MTTAEISELELIALAKQGDQQAFATLIQGASRRMWAVAYSVTGNQHDAEDAMQNALTAIWKNLATFEPRAKFSTWAYRIASNAALQLIRSRREVLSSEDDTFEVASPVSTDSQVTASLVVQKALSALPEEFREALVLREYGGLSYDEIAVQQKIGVQTVKSRINRARKKLREELEALGLTSSDL